jgi:hypothetical protein
MMQNTRDCSPSPFIDEIPNELIKIHEIEKETVDEGSADRFMEQLKSILKD